MKRTLAKLHEFCHKVEKELHLDGVWDLKPLINGQELMQLLGLPPGPAIRQHLERYRQALFFTPPHDQRADLITHHATQRREMAWQLSHMPSISMKQLLQFTLHEQARRGMGSGWSMRKLV